MIRGLVCQLTVAVLACGIVLRGQDDITGHLHAALQFHQRGEFAAAEKILLEVMKETDSRQEDLATAVALNNLGSAYHHLDRYFEAERAYRRAMDICDRLCAPDDILRTRFPVNLASLYLEAGQPAKAGRLGLRALASRTGTSRRDARDEARLMAVLGGLAQSDGRRSESEHHYRQALAIWERLGPDNSAMIPTLTNLGALCSNMDRDSEALSHYERALAIAEKALGPEHPMQAKLLTSIGALHFKMHGPVKAEGFYRRALETAERSLGPDHPLVGQILVPYAAVLRQAKRKSEAGRCQRRANAILQSASLQDQAKQAVDFRDLKR